MYPSRGNLTTHITIFYTHFLKMMPNFWQLGAVCLCTKYNNLHWICVFSAKNLSNFVFHHWKLYNPYYHILYKSPHVTLKSLMTRCIDQVMIIGWKNILMKHSPVSSYCTMGWYNLWKTILFFPIHELW